MGQLKTFIGYFYIYVFICLMSTFYRAWFPQFAQTQWLLIAASVLSVIVNVGFYKSKAFIWLALYFVVLLVNRSSGDDYFKEISTCFFEFMVPLFAMNLFYYSTKNDNPAYNKILIVTFTIIVAIVAIGSMLMDKTLPEIVRNMQTATEGDLQQLDYYYKLGVSNYALPHALPALVPLIVYALKQNRKGSIIWIFYLVTLIFFLLLIYYSASSGAILLAIFALVLSLLTNKDGISNRSVIWACVIFLPLILSNGLMNWVIQILIDIFGGSSSAQSFTAHLVDISNSLASTSGTTGDVDSRVDMYQITFNDILNHFLLGTNETTGGHMALLDRFARLGIVGFIPLIMTYISYFKPIMLQVDYRVKPFFIESLAIAFLMMTLKNMIHNEMNVVLFAMIPLLAVYFSREYEGETI